MRVNLTTLLLFGEAFNTLTNPQATAATKSHRAKPKPKPSKHPTTTPTTMEPTIPTKTQKPPPNIMLIVADDFSGREFNNPNTQANFVNLNALKASGVNFRNAITVDPVCGPSRNAMLTGTPNVKTFDQSYHAFGYASLFQILRYGIAADGRPNTEQRKEIYFTAASGKVMHFYPPLLPRDILYTNGETSVPNPIYTAGNSECPGKNIGCTLDKKQSADTVVTRIAINQMRSCAQRIDNGINQACFLAVGYKHTHVEMVGYKRKSLRSRLEFDRSEPEVALDGLRLALRYKVCTEIAGYKINNRQMARNGDAVNTISNNNVQAAYLYYLAAHDGVDAQVGDLLNAARAQKLADGSNLADNMYILFTSDHGFAFPVQGNMWCKRNPDDQSMRVPLIIAGPGIRSDIEINTPVNNHDIFCTILALAYPQQTFYTHPSGVKPTCVSLVPQLVSNTPQVRKWAFSSVARCDDPNGRMISNSCTSDTVDGSCDRPPINWIGFTAMTMYNGELCSFTGWWPWKEVRLGCGKQTWYGQPTSLIGVGTNAPLIDYANSGPIFTRNGVPVAPIQRELYCFDAAQTRHKNNQIGDPKYAAFVTTAIAAIKETNNKVGGRFPYPGPQ